MLLSAFRAGSSLAVTMSRLTRWPVFSVTSHRLVSDLLKQRVFPAFVVDVGANRGQFAVAVLELLPTATVLSFEPLPAQASGLANLGRRYGSRLEVRNLALGSSRSHLDLNVNKHHQASSLRPLAPRHVAAFPDALNTSSVQVQVDRLDAQLSREDVPPGSMLKIDVQGFERDVIIGAEGVLTCFDTLLIEASFSPLYEGEWTFMEMVSELATLGFDFVRPVGFLRDPADGEYLQIDALFKRSASVDR